MMDAIQKAAKALAQLSNSEWAQVKCDEEERRGLKGGSEDMPSQNELINLKSDIEELRADIRKVEDFIMRMLDRIVELERDRRAREAREAEEEEANKAKP